MFWTICSRDEITENELSARKRCTFDGFRPTINFPTVNENDSQWCIKNTSATIKCICMFVCYIQYTLYTTFNIHLITVLLEWHRRNKHRSVRCFVEPLKATAAGAGSAMKKPIMCNVHVRMTLWKAHHTNTNTTIVVCSTYIAMHIKSSRYRVENSSWFVYVHYTFHIHMKLIIYESK